MTRSAILKEILCDIGKRLVSEEKMTDVQCEDLEDSIDFAIPPNSREWFDGIDCGGYSWIIDLINKVEDVQEDPEITAPLYVGYHTVTEERYKSELKPLVVYDPDSRFGLLTGAALNQIANINQDSLILNDITLIWANLRDNANQKDRFLDFCKNPLDDSFYVLNNEQINDLWDAYGYACLYKINSNKFELDPDLSFNPNTELHPSLRYNIATPYKQYFDIYHVISESKHCTDILKRYLMSSPEIA